MEADIPESLLEAMVDAYNAVQSPADRGYAQQEMGMQAALQVYLDNAAQLPASAPSVSVDEEFIQRAIVLLETAADSGMEAFNEDGSPTPNRELYLSTAKGLRAEASKADTHASDCATHNEPAYQNGPCDCEQPSGELGKSAEQEKVCECWTCFGTGRVVRDPDIGTDQECFVCDGSGRIVEREQENIPDGDDYEERKLRERDEDAVLSKKAGQE